MHRAVPVGNKVCAARVRKRYEDQRAQRLRDMKPQIDTRPPETTGYAHLKTNFKRDMMLMQRHDQIEHENMLMLGKMHDFARKSELTGMMSKSSSLPSLRCPGGPAQQREYDRIMQANAQMLDRLQNMQGELNFRKLEDNYAKSTDYVKLACEYPPPLLKRKTKRGASGSSLTRLPGEHAGRVPDLQEQALVEDPYAVAEDPIEDGGDLRYVMREHRPIDGISYFVEMATDGRILAISIYNAEADQGYELLVSEENHQTLCQECLGDYVAVADRLFIDGEQLLVAPMPRGDWEQQQIAGQVDAADPAAHVAADADGADSSVVDVEDDDDEGLSAHGLTLGAPPGDRQDGEQSEGGVSL